jgi:SMI1 / KNR4 family (SUKH-1)
MDVFDARGEPLTEAELGNLARPAAAELPASCREFMATGDGGVFLDPNRYGSSFRGGLNELFAVREASPSYWSFASVLDVYRDRVPEGFLPIGDDLAGNLIVLGVDGKHRRRVYFWNHEREADEGEPATMDNMELVAGSFREFLDGIRIAE